MDFKGYLLLKSDEDVFIGLDPYLDSENYLAVKSKLTKTVLPIMDVGVGDSGFLCLGPKGICLIDVRNKNSVSNYFLCDFQGDVMLPLGLDIVQKTIEACKRLARKGGYNRVIRQMVVAASLQKGRFYDDFLFENQ